MKSWLIKNLRKVIRKLGQHKKSVLVKMILEDSDSSEEVYETLRQNNLVKQKIIADFKDSIPGFEYLNMSFSQNGEDLVLLRLLENHPIGKFIDAGAFHPIKYSNTFLLYKLGWVGFNIDANYNSIVEFNLNRPNDLNLCLAISNGSRKATYCSYTEEALNTISEKRELDLLKIGKIPNNKIQIQTYDAKFLLESIFDEKTYLANFDLEGTDLEIILSLDYNLFSPCILLIESSNEIVVQSLNEKYELVSTTFNTQIYRSYACKKGNHGLVL